MRLRKLVRDWLDVDKLVEHELNKRFAKTETLMKNTEHVIREGGEDLNRVRFDITLAISDAVNSLVILKQELQREERDRLREEEDDGVG
jgi:hypothetical protein